MATTGTGQSLRTYRGNCHCGAFVYEAELPEIKSVFQCNCSICHKKGYLWVFTGEGRFNVIQGMDETLTSYSFGPKKLVHKFCPTCATPVMGQFPGDPPGKQRALNARAMQGVNTSELEKKLFDGAALGDKYLPPEYKGEIPSAIEANKLYTGTCHCGAVGVALMSKPLDSTFDDLTMECNCSICERNGYIWVYPEVQRVVLYAHDPSNIARYSFARRMLSKTFCKICGVPMTNEYKALPEEEIDGLSEQDQRLLNSCKNRHPVNLRVFPDVDLKAMKPPSMNDGANRIEPLYLNP